MGCDEYTVPGAVIAQIGPPPEPGEDSDGSAMDQWSRMAVELEGELR